MTRGARRGVSILALTTLAAVPAVALTAAWQYGEANVPPPTTTTSTTVPPEPTDELTTPLLSFRRHPTPLAEDAAASAEARALADLRSDLTTELRPGTCLRVVAADGSPVAELDPRAPVIPASNQKLLVAAVALQVLGPDYRFRTELQTAVPPVGGVVAGDVFLVGGGDPLLVTADVPDLHAQPAFNTTPLEPLADQLVALGITRIDGALVGDGTRYDDEFHPPSWSDELTNFDGGPIDALLVNDGQIDQPGNYGLVPERSAAREFTDLLTARGVTVVAQSDNYPRPAGVAMTTLAAIESRPLTEVLVEMLHTSDNNTAEMILKEIGFVATGTGSRQAGLDTIWRTLGEWAVPLDGVAMADGSGLGRDNRVSCATLTGLLAGAPVSERLVGLLPVAGRDGTLADDLLGTPAEGALRAKTGTLTDVKALAGVQPDSNGDEVAFALVLNGSGADTPDVYDPLWRRLVDLIADFPVEVAPDPAPFGPR